MSAVGGGWGKKRETRPYEVWGEDRYSYGSAAEYCRATTMRYTGQRQESTIGLYFYGARWYDRALGRFIQADTIVPNELDPIAYDRYAYIRNDPIILTDPSGHNYCDSKYAASEDCQDPFYDVNISDDFTEDEKAEIMAAILAISAKLGGWWRFNSVFGGTTFLRDTNLGSWGGKYRSDGVHLNPKLITEYIVTHEMGHVFQGLLDAKDNPNTPANQLIKPSNAIVNDAGKVVSGIVNGDYRRFDMGYQACPNEKACQFEEHPTSIDINATPPENPNNPYEDAADMFLNWVYDSFTADSAGTARYEWWDSRMSGWVDTLQ